MNNLVINSILQFVLKHNKVGYGILKNEYEDTNNITKIEPSTVYYEERQRLVDEALQKNGCNYYPLTLYSLIE